MYSTLKNLNWPEIEKEIRDADEQARWETRYWHERDYGGRL